MLNAKNIHIQPDKTLLFAYIVQILPVENHIRGFQIQYRFSRYIYYTHTSVFGIPYH